MSIVLLFCAITLISADAPPADGLHLLPPTALFDGKNDTLRPVVETAHGGRFDGDVTAQARFESSDPRVATVSADGTIVPVGDGEATISAVLGGDRAMMPIKVRNAGKAKPRSFRNDVLPVLTRLGCNSGACHGAAAGKNGLRLTLRGYAPEVDHDVLTRQALGRRINKTAPAESLFLLKATGAIVHGGGVRTTPESPEYRLLGDWIAEGAPPPGEGDPHVTAVKAYPGALRLPPGKSQRLVVLATYSDGSIRDVTRWSKFDSTDAGVAKVDEHGILSGVGEGEGAVSVWYSSLVDLVTVTSPYQAAYDPALLASAPRNNAIDEKNLEKLRALGLPPSPPCDDATFLRRAYLDATGTLPPPDVVDSFLSDGGIDKRARLIDSLLNSQEYIDYWAYKWSDVMLVSSKKLGSPAVWAFYRFVRRAVEDNVPWDEFARRVVTAKGSTLSNGAANYFVLHRDPIDLAESTSVAFLGLSLTCARCHNHPMEKWTQDQYYGFANLFSRVSLKDGVGANGAVTAGDVVVSAAPEGEILHPRRGLVMSPQPLDARPLLTEDRADRRLALADWLASPENPYFDRAIVNRVWANFLGRGIIEPEDDLRATNPPSDPVLLEFLVQDFRAHRRDVKHLIRMIMNSGVYQRSSAALRENASDAKFLSHYLPKRLSAEVLLDAIDRVTGVPTSYAGYPRGWRSLQLPDSRVENAFLDSFGRPVREAVCSCERSDEPSVAQALNLTNGNTLNDKLRDDKGRVAQLASGEKSDAEVITKLYASAFSRRPSTDEMKTLSELLVSAVAGETDPEAAKKARRQAIEDLFWATLTSKEFLFGH